MSQLSKIRRLYYREERSIRSISRFMGLSRNTVRDWLRKEGDVKEPKYASTPRPKQLDEYKELLDGWLKANEGRNSCDCKWCVAQVSRFNKKIYKFNLAIECRLCINQHSSVYTE